MLTTTMLLFIPLLASGTFGIVAIIAAIIVDKPQKGNG